MALLSITNLHASIEGKEILKGVNLTVGSGELHVLMGPNGEGKSTLAQALMGKPGIVVTSGAATLGENNILTMKPEERFRAGLFLAFQNPRELPGVNMLSVMRLAAQRSAVDVFQDLKVACAQVGLKEDLIQRPLNEGFSGGEKKRAELVQLMVLKPHIAILDEIDSGLDVDGLKMVAEQVTALVQEKNMGILLITHNPVLVQFLQPTKVHVFVGGKIVKEGGAELVHEIEQQGYGSTN